MGIYKTRPPEAYSMAFNRPMAAMLEIIRNGGGEPKHTFNVETLCVTEKAALQERRRYCAFRTMIRRHPSHPYNEVLELYTVRTYIWSFMSGWGLHLTFERHTERQKALEKSLTGYVLR